MRSCSSCIGDVPMHSCLCIRIFARALLPPFCSEQVARRHKARVRTSVAPVKQCPTLVSRLCRPSVRLACSELPWAWEAWVACRSRRRCRLRLCRSRRRCRLRPCRSRRPDKEANEKLNKITSKPCSRLYRSRFERTCLGSFNTYVKGT